MHVFSGGWLRGGVAAGLFGLAFALYAGSLTFGFVDFDDRTVLLGHPNLYDETSLRASLHEIFVGYFPREEPLLLRDVTWAIDARLFGFENPFGYHLGNVLLHAANVVLVFLLLERLTRRLGLAAVLAGLFALLPVHVEPVCWVMGRKDVLAGFFMLAALLVQAGALSRGDGTLAWRHHAAITALAVAALFSKISAASLFLVLGLHRVFHPWIAGQRAPDAPLRVASLRPLVSLAPLAAVSVAVAAWYHGVLEAYGVVGWRGPAPLSREHLETLAVFDPLVLALYLKRLVWPDQLSLFYAWPAADQSLPSWALALSAGTAAAALAGTAWVLRRRKDAAFYWLAFLAFLLPYSNLVYVGFWMANRYLYLAAFALLAGVGVLAGRALESRPPAWRRAAALATVTFALLCTVQNVRQQGAWRSNHALWLHETSLDRPSVLAFQALAKSYFEQARVEPDPTARAALAREAEDAISRGIARYESVPRRASSYAVPARRQYAQLHLLRGRLAALRGEPLDTRLGHLERAHAIAPQPLSALLLAAAYFEAASSEQGGERRRLARTSLDFLEETLRIGPPDRVWRTARLRPLLRDYRSRFPFLAGQVSDVTRSYFP